MALELDEGATVADAYDRLAADQPEIAPALAGTLAVISGAHAERERPLRSGEELALLMPVSGG